MAKSNIESESASLGVSHIPLVLMQTFVLIADHDGDAATAGRVLGISQPSMSRRISALRELTSRHGGQPWLLLKGKKWLVTAEGQRVRGVVSDLVRRFEQAERFIADTSKAPLTLSIACDHLNAVGMVGRAVEEYLRQNPHHRVRLAAPSSEARITGVAAGEFDFAIVSDDPATIFEVARVELYVQELYRDRFLAISKPAYFAEWKNRWEKLPVRRPLRGTDLERFPLILPESGSAERRFLEECYQRAVGRLPDAVVEVVGWEVILRFGLAGVGVGIITEQALKNHLVDLSTTEQKKIPKHTHRLDDDDFPSESVNLVARRLHGQGEPDLRPHASELLRLIEAQGKSPSKPAMSLK